MTDIIDSAVFIWAVGIFWSTLTINHQSNMFSPCTGRMLTKDQKFQGQRLELLFIYLLILIPHSTGKAADEWASKRDKEASPSPDTSKLNKSFFKGSPYLRDSFSLLFDKISKCFRTWCSALHSIKVWWMGERAYVRNRNTCNWMLCYCSSSSVA